MTVALLWMLLAVSDGGYNRGTSTTVGHYVKYEECMKVRAALLRMGGRSEDVKAECVQAEAVVVK